MIAGSPKLMKGTASTIEFSARAVTIPGSAIGSTKANEIVLRPKNENRCTANEASVPRISASVVAAIPALIELNSAGFNDGSCHACENHSVVHRSGGQDAVRVLLKA